jgi:hypothetical protein
MSGLESGIFGFDANGPKVDHPDVAANVYWHDGCADDREEYLLHDPARAPHDFADALRRYLADHPSEAQAIRVAAPSGPLAVSHCRKNVPCRYDFIFVSRGYRPVEIPRYLTTAILQPCDHAPVLATFVTA